MTLDLSKLNELWVTMEALVVYLKQRIKECVKEVHKQNPSLKEKLRKGIHERLGSNPVQFSLYLIISIQS